MSIADRLRNEGLIKGRAEAWEEARQEAKREEQANTKQRIYTQVLTSLRLGLDIDIISQITGLSHSEIQAMR